MSALSQRFQLRDTSVRVQEIAPPWVDTDLIYKSGDPRAMPLPDFIEQTLVALATDAPEVIVEEIMGAFAARYDLDVETVSAAEENEFFPLPRSLRPEAAAE